MKRLVALLLIALAGCAGDEPDADLLIRADRLFDGERFHEPGAIVIRGSRILEAGPEVSGDAKRTIDLGDATILPGFIDLHVHSTGAGLVRRGVTTVRDLGRPMAFIGVNEGSSARVLEAGPILTTPGGYPGPVYVAVGLEVRGPREARAAVRDLARRGVDIVKIALEQGTGWPILSVTEVRAIVDEAHRQDLRVTAHVTAQHTAEIALEAGVDEFAHFPCGGLLPETRQELIERGVEVVATLHALDLQALFCADPVAAAREFVAVGGRLLYGTDIGVLGIPHGIDRTELRMLRRAGLSPVEVLAAATSQAGAHLGLAPLGRLVPSAPADVIAIAGDARRFPRSFDLPQLVVRAGRLVVDPEEE